MDTFDFFDNDPGNHRPSEDELAGALRQLFERRSTDITEASPFSLDTAAARSAELAEDADWDGDGTVVHRLSERWLGRADSAPGGLAVSLMAAAAVLLLVLGSLLAAQAIGRHTGRAANQPGNSGRPAISDTTPTATPAPVQPLDCPWQAGWAQRIATGTVRVDQPQNYPMAGFTDGSFLMVQSASTGQQDTHRELAIFDRSGHGTTIWQASDPMHEFVDVSPDSAMSDHWVVFGLTRSQSLADFGVAAWNRSSRQLTVVRTQSPADIAADNIVDFDPIVVGDTAYWIEQKFSDSAHQTLVAQPLPTGTPTRTAVSQIGRLVALGGGVGVLRSGHGPIAISPDDPVSLTAGPGLRLPAKVRALATGSDFAADGESLRWLRTHDGATWLVRWQSGHATADPEIRMPLQSARPVGPFVVGTKRGGDAVLDTRSGSVQRLPAGVTFALVAGGDLITSTGGSKLGGAVIDRVALGSLTPARC